MDRTRYPDYMQEGKLRTLLANDKRGIVIWNGHVYLAIQNIAKELKDIDSFEIIGDKVNQTGLAALWYDKEKDCLMVYEKVTSDRLVMLLLNTSFSMEEIRRILEIINDNNIKVDDEESLLSYYDIDRTMSFAFSLTQGGKAPSEDEEIKSVEKHKDKFKVTYKNQVIKYYWLHADVRTKNKRKDNNLGDNEFKRSGFIITDITEDFEN